VHALTLGLTLWRRDEALDHHRGARRYSLITCVTWPRFFAHMEN
jgi:hypothetical protein